jgi:hypothetical protein
MKIRTLFVIVLAVLILIPSGKALAWLLTKDGGPNANDAVPAPTASGASVIECMPGARTIVEVAWSPVAPDLGEGYEILRSTSSGGPYTSLATIMGSDVSMYQDTTGAPSTSYFYVVRTARGVQRSADSTEVFITTPSASCA